METQNNSEPLSNQNSGSLNSTKTPDFKKITILILSVVILVLIVLVVALYIHTIKQPVNTNPTQTTKQSIVPKHNINNTTTPGIQGSWLTTTALPTATSSATSVVYKGYAYEIGGENQHAALSTVDYAHILPSGTLGSWTATTSLPQATSSATSVVYAGFIYEIGGTNGGNDFSTVDYAPINSNGTLGSWTATSSLPTATNVATSVEYNGYVYEITGCTPATACSTTTVDYAPINSNGTLGSWIATTPLSTALSGATSVVYNGYVYEIGGMHGNQATVTTVDYAPINSNGTLGSWTVTTSLPQTTNYATSVVYNGYIYEIGGAVLGGDSGSVTVAVDYALINSNGTLGSWTATTSLPVATQTATSVTYNGYVYEIGGFTTAITPTAYYAKL
ncbi:MAG: Kelch repeat-containing protein [Patescibacteria group bacterium]